MGQNSSSQRRHSSAVAGVGGRAADATVDVDAQDDDVTPSTANTHPNTTASKRRSLRNSLRALVPGPGGSMKPKIKRERERPASMSFASTSASVGASASAGLGGRRRWSRRASSFVSPSAPPDMDEEDGAGEPDEFGLLDGSGFASTTNDVRDDRDEEPDLPRERPATPMPPPLSASPQLTTSSTPAHSPQSYIPERQTQTQSQAPPPQTQAQPQPQPQHHPRTFPPPGTLVVVQGVVHTTDIPRNDASASAHHPNTTSSATDTASSINNATPAANSVGGGGVGASAQTGVGHPHPHPHPHPISSSSIDVLGTLLTVAAQATAASLLTGSSDGLLARAASASNNAANTNTNTNSSSAGNSTSTASDSSSNNNLGSSPSGHGNNSASSGPPSSENADASGAGGDTSTIASSYRGSGSGRLPRRTPWSALRDRLGGASSYAPPRASTSPALGGDRSDADTTTTTLDSAPSATAASPSSDTSPAPALYASQGRDAHVQHGERQDDRSVMLAEMARAFNLGLGLGPPGSGRANRGQGQRTMSSPVVPTRRRMGAVRANSTPVPLLGSDGDENGESAGAEGEGHGEDIGEGTGEHEEQEQEQEQEPEPAEGTFERFLVDLQADLRVALGASPLAASSASDALAATDSLVPAVATEDVPGREGHEAEDAHAYAEADDDHPHPPLDSISAANPSPNPSTAPQEEVSAEPSSAPPQLQAPVQQPIQQQPQAHAAPGTGPGAVNWWRVYRFPPIIALPLPLTARVNGALPALPALPAGGDTSSSSASSASDGGETTTDSSPTTASSSSDGASAPSSAAAAAAADPDATAPARPQTVVPVIVVGLQSVALGAAMGMFGGLAGLGIPHGAHANPNANGAAAAAGGPRASDAGGAEEQRQMREGLLREIARVRGVAAGSPEVTLERTHSDAQTQADGNGGGAQEGEEHAQQDGEGAEEVGAGARARRRSWWRPLSMGFGRRRRGVEVSGPSDSTADDEEVGDEDGEAEPEVGEPAAVGENVEGERTMPPPAEEGAAQAGAEGAAPAAAQAQGPPQGQAPALPLPDTSRTFLIYVIGGYYPPEHGILNGAEGFEALLDLTELLGPLRPPTASKADIARAGLAIVRRADLAGLESEGKVVNNCVDRCLICLDDYDEADEIRVLSCRHAFHQTCVDRWLETGRNNCPACRSKGVSTDPTTPPPPPPVATEAH